MRIVKAVTLMIALVFGGLAFELMSPQQVQAADDLQDTSWDSAAYDFSFGKGGALEVWDGEGEFTIKGKYRLTGSSVEMTFENFHPASATINGNRMTVKWLGSDGSIEEFVLTKKQ